MPLNGCFSISSTGSNLLMGKPPINKPPDIGERTLLILRENRNVPHS